MAHAETNSQSRRDLRRQVVILGKRGAHSYVSTIFHMLLVFRFVSLDMTCFFFFSFFFSIFCSSPHSTATPPARHPTTRRLVHSMTSAMSAN